MILNLLQIGSLTKQHQLCKYLYLLENNKKERLKKDLDSLLNRQFFKNDIQ